MADFKSFTRYEHELSPKFRNNLNHAESTEDVKKFFTYSMQDLLMHVLGDSADVRFEDVALGGDGFTVSPRLHADPGYARAIAGSDLKAIMQRFAESARHRVRHLDGHPEKTQSKIRGH